MANRVRDGGFVSLAVFSAVLKSLYCQQFKIGDQTRVRDAGLA